LKIVCVSCIIISGNKYFLISFCSRDALVGK
jgi:hypothetical protein